MSTVRPAAPTTATATRRTPAPAADGPTTLVGVTYATVPGFRPLRLDLHLPSPARQPAPLVVFVHGGGWFTGAREMLGPRFADWSPSPFERLTAAGLAVATVDYRLSGEATWPAPLEDVVAALRWLRARGGDLGLDTARTALWGESAGGHLAAIAGLLGSDPQRGAGRVRAVVDWYGPADLLSLESQLAPGASRHSDPAKSRESLMLGAAVATVPDRAADASPLHHVTPGAPPFLLLHGQADRFVPARQSELLAEALLRHGVPVRLQLFDGADHLWMGSEAAPREAFDLTVAFLLEHLA